ncbi:hypothetical protein AV926_06705 [Myroides marinus]|uniref:DUF4349 domain-containing protein n=2 Tax=Myroides marinus TaxID=703342 RepID=A0A164A0L4_9FLAO|nr:hypothetical protein AS361_03130 [Myroides marinus]KZE82790.1 hypothetical protein AV926_06705 [Myroides marinus]
MNAMKKTNLLLIIITLVICVACGQNKEYLEPSGETTEYASTAEKATTTSSTDTSKEEPQTQPPQNTDNRKVIKEGLIRFKTASAKESRKLISQCITDYNGYLAQDDVNTKTGIDQYTVTIRVPAENFEKLLDRVTDNALQIESKDIKAIDITEQYVDLEARIKTKKEMESRFKELLKRANTMEEIFVVEKEIEKIRSDIESSEGRLNVLRNRAAFSTLSLEFYEQDEPVHIEEDKGYGFKESFLTGWSGLMWFFSGLLNIWPFILLLIAAIIAFKKFYNNK